ncbi:MAG: drug/metabolite transporter (DMT)-like permease [Halocynthiibacter sp.]|jgi:drug/metabolite transporter (DMT)-like permease
MLITGALFVCVTAIVRYVGAGLPAAEAAFLRYIFGLFFLIPLLRPMLRVRPDARQLRFFALRGAVHAIAVMLWFFSMARLPIAEVTAMNYLSPVYVTLLAVVFLKEKLAARRIIAVLVALLGAMIILRPGVRAIDAGHLAMLIAAMLFAVSYLIAKIMADELPSELVVGMMSITVAIGLAPFAYAVWIVPTGPQMGWMALTAAIATAGHYTMTLAFKAAPVTVTQPVSFLQLVWATALGFFAFGEGVDIWVIAGGALILASVSFITWREAVLKRRAITPAAMATKV